MTQAPESPPPVDERRHAELIERHVHGSPARRQVGGKATWFRYASASSVGIEIAVAIVGATLVARWLETNYTHWAPWTTLIGFAVGIGAAVKALVRTARQYQDELEAHRQRELVSDDAPATEGPAPQATPKAFAEPDHELRHGLSSEPDEDRP